MTEAEIRASLPTRLAGVLRVLPEKGDSRPSTTFASLFNGARQGWLNPNGGAFFGKAEAEWGWPHDWKTLSDAGLITYNLETVTHPTGNQTTYVHWNVTDRGWEVRQDDLKWYRELMDAIHAAEDAKA